MITVADVQLTLNDKKMMYCKYGSGRYITFVTRLHS